jgi:hypothetical protein
VPIWYIEMEPRANEMQPWFDYRSLLKSLNPNSPIEHRHCDYRAVSLDRLGTILKTGIDVEPSDSVIYTGPFDKAWEYGGWPKVILMLDWQVMEKTSRQVHADTPPGELDVWRKSYPTELRSSDGIPYWLSRLPETSKRIATDYEIAHAWWIPGNALEALKAILIFGEMPGGVSSLLPIDTGQSVMIADADEAGNEA